MVNYERAYDQGYKAFFNGWPITCSPYDEAHPDHYQWIRGWRAARS